MSNIAVGIYLFNSGHGPAFILFLTVAAIGVLMYEVLHLVYNVLPKLLKRCRKKGGKYMWLSNSHTHTTHTLSLIHI